MNKKDYLFKKKNNQIFKKWRQPNWENTEDRHNQSNTMSTDGALVLELTGRREMYPQVKRTSSSLRGRVLWLEVTNANGNKL